MTDNVGNKHGSDDVYDIDEHETTEDLIEPFKYEKVLIISKETQFVVM